MPSILILANQTATSRQLIAEVARRHAEPDCTFTLLVPAVAPKLSTLQGMTSAATNVPYRSNAGIDEYEVARHQLGAAIEAFRQAGVRVTGDVGDPDPLKAVERYLAGNQVDEIIVSTLSTAVSRWLHQDLPSKLHRKFGIPVTVVTAQS